MMQSDQKKQKEDERLEELLLQAIESGPATPMTKKDWKAIKERGLERSHANKAGKFE